MTTALALLLLNQDRPSPEWRPVLDAPAILSHELVLPTPEHPGPRLELRGRVLRADRKTPVANVVLYFHHADGRGIYPRRPNMDPADWAYWHGYLRGWLKTDREGSFVVKTTKPAPYPSGREPAHIHVYGLLPGSRIGVSFPAYLFEGDPHLNDDYWRRNRPDGGYRFSRLTPSAQGNGLLCERDLILPS